jgi:hypothetical protein
MCRCSQQLSWMPRRCPCQALHLQYYSTTVLQDCADHHATLVQALRVLADRPTSLEGFPWLQADNKGARLLAQNGNPAQLRLTDAHGNVVAPPPGTAATATLQLQLTDAEAAAAGAAPPDLAAVENCPLLEGTSGVLDGMVCMFGGLAVVKGSGQGFVQPDGTSLVVRFDVVLPDGTRLSEVTQVYYSDNLTTDAQKQEAQQRCASGSTKLHRSLVCLVCAVGCIQGVPMWGLGVLGSLYAACFVATVIWPHGAPAVSEPWHGMALTAAEASACHAHQQ